MNVEQLHVVLQSTFSADATIRRPAEETLKGLKNIPGSVKFLLQVAEEKQVCWLLLVCPSYDPLLMLK